MQPLLEVEDLNVWFDLPNGSKLHAVRGVSFSVTAGTRLGIVGESGSGKTTMILALMGLLPPTACVSGRIAFEGDDLLERGEETIAPHRWKDIAMVFQGAMNAFDPVKRIGEQIVEPMELHGNATGKEATARVRELLETVGIQPGRAKSYPHELSGGMRQRAAIAMALACNPQHPARGRADDRARRDGAGADPSAPHAPVGRARTRARLCHARPADRRPDVHARAL